MSKRIAIFPGSFDPFTKGHEDIVRRGATLFDEVIIAIGVNSGKKRHYRIELMTEKINTTFSDNSAIRVESYEGLTATLAKDLGATHILRGLRNTTDFEYENAIAQGNKHLYPGLETVFLITTPALAYISSSITREIHKHGGDVSEFLPYDL